jgi:hypothetical protein
VRFNDHLLKEILHVSPCMLRYCCSLSVMLDVAAFTETSMEVRRAQCIWVERLQLLGVLSAVRIAGLRCQSVDCVTR